MPYPGLAIALLIKDLIQSSSIYLCVYYYYFFSSFAGSYTAAEGINVVRQDIAHFISQRDGYPAASDNIVVTSGGAEGIEVSRNCTVH